MLYTLDQHKVICQLHLIGKRRKRGLLREEVGGVARQRGGTHECLGTRQQAELGRGGAGQVGEQWTWGGSNPHIK